MQLDGEVTALETWKDFVFIAVRIKDDQKESDGKILIRTGT